MNIYDEILADPVSSEDQKAAARKMLELGKISVTSEGTGNVTLRGEIQQFNYDTRKMDRVKVELVVSRDAVARLRAKVLVMQPALMSAINSGMFPTSFYDGYAASLGYGEIMLAQLDEAHVKQLRSDYPESDIPDALTDAELEGK